MKKIPGPLAPPARSLPSRNMTDLSYSWTTSTNIFHQTLDNLFCIKVKTLHYVHGSTLTQKKREKGRVRRTRRRENIARRRAQHPGPATSAEYKIKSLRYSFLCQLPGTLGYCGLALKIWDVGLLIYSFFHIIPTKGCPHIWGGHSACTRKR